MGIDPWFYKFWLEAKLKSRVRDSSKPEKNWACSLAEQELRGQDKVAAKEKFSLEFPWEELQQQPNLRKTPWKNQAACSGF